MNNAEISDKALEKIRLYKDELKKLEKEKLEIMSRARTVVEEAEKTKIKKEMQENLQKFEELANESEKLLQRIKKIGSKI